jgi:hypothetical protein
MAVKDQTILNPIPVPFDDVIVTSVSGYSIDAGVGLMPAQSELFSVRYKIRKIRSSLLERNESSNRSFFKPLQKR